MCDEKLLMCGFLDTGKEGSGTPLKSERCRVEARRGGTEGEGEEEAGRENVHGVCACAGPSRGWLDAGEVVMGRSEGGEFADGVNASR